MPWQFACGKRRRSAGGICCTLAKSCSYTLGLGRIWLSLLAACRLGLGERSTAISDLAHHQILASNLFDRPRCLFGRFVGRAERLADNQIARTCCCHEARKRECSRRVMAYNEDDEQARSFEGGSWPVGRQLSRRWMLSVQGE